MPRRSRSQPGPALFGHVPELRRWLQKADQSNPPVRAEDKPFGPKTNRSDRRPTVRTEDHPFGLSLSKPCLPTTKALRQAQCERVVGQPQAVPQAASLTGSVLQAASRTGCRLPKLPASPAAGAQAPNKPAASSQSLGCRLFQSRSVCLPRLWPRPQTRFVQPPTRAGR